MCRHLTAWIPIDTYAYLRTLLELCLASLFRVKGLKLQGGSNMTGTDLCVNKPHCAVAVRP